MKKFLLAFILGIATILPGFSQDPIEKVGILWDTSYGMVDRNISAELEFLNDFFIDNPNIQVELVIFSNTILAEESYVVENSDWTTLKDELSSSISDGATSYSGIFKENVDKILLFTDAKSLYGDLPASFNKPIVSVLSVPGGNKAELQKLATVSGGQFVDLTATGANNSTSNKEQLTVTGYVTAEGNPLEGVLVHSRELNIEAQTDKSGNYSIKAVKDGVIKFSRYGKKTYITRVPTNGIKNIEMQDGSETLDEVLITAEKRRDEKEVSLGMTKRPESSIGYAVATIDETQITEQDIDLETAVTGQFSNINLKSDQDITQFLARGRNMSILLDQTGLIVVDGVPMPSDPQLKGGVTGDKTILSRSGLLSPDNIAEISVLKGLAATNKWGTIGRNGVILITTKSGSPNYKAANLQKEVSLGTTETYKGGALIIEELPNTEYIEELKTASDVDHAYSIYLKQRQYFGDEAAFFFNTATYFKKYQNNFVIEKILSSVSELDGVTDETLLALTYKMQEMGLFKAASPILELLIERNPKDIQFYRNLALNYHMAGELEKSLSLYKQIDRMQIRGVTSYDNLKGTIDNEYKNLLALNGDRMKLSGINPQMLTNLKLDTRVVVEWNEFDAEFDLQIVNPQNRYYTWSHTKKNEPSRFNRELELGYGLEEYFMTVDDKGVWLFNLTYYGNVNTKENKPMYLKITKYDNFGSPNQTQHIKVIAIEDLNKPQTLMTVKI